MKISQIFALGVYAVGGLFAASPTEAAQPNSSDLYTATQNYPKEEITLVGVPYDSAGVVHYTTIAGYDRQVPYAIRYPNTAKGPLPVVVWAHGGTSQPKTRVPATVLPEWSNVTAQSGYITVTILHVNDTPDQALAMCNALGYPVPTDTANLANGISTLVAALGANPFNPDPDVVDNIINTYPDLISLIKAESQSGIEYEDARIDLAIAKLLERLDTCRFIHQTGMQNRPNDIQAVMDAIRAHALPDFPYDLVEADPTQIPIVAAGHSNGTNTSLSTVGQQRAIANGIRIARPTSQFPGTRVVGAIALSPMGVNQRGVFDTGVTGPNQSLHSWSNVDKDVPVLMLTGDGDNRCETDRFVCGAGDSPVRRMGAYQRLSADGNKYLMYIADRNSSGGSIVSSHEVFGGDRTACVDGYTGQCKETAQWLVSTVLAFIDAAARDDAQAKKWLKSGKLKSASNGIADITLK